MDEDGDLAHEFYQEKKVRNKKGVVRWIMQRISTAHLVPQVGVSVGVSVCEWIGVRSDLVKQE